MPHRPLTPQDMLMGYAAGIFPMAEGRHDPEVHWIRPNRRGIIPLGGFRLSRSLARRMRSGVFRVTVDTDFAAVVDGCADRPETWINPPIRAAYLALHAAGHAHAVEVRDAATGALAGGIFGVALGAAFFGESMFSRRTDASKVALACLVDMLRAGGFTLFDTQFLTPHLASLGGVEVDRTAYGRLLTAALAQRATFGTHAPDLHAVVQSSSRTP